MALPFSVHRMLALCGTTAHVSATELPVRTTLDRGSTVKRGTSVDDDVITPGQPTDKMKHFTEGTSDTVNGVITCSAKEVMYWPGSVCNSGCDPCASISLHGWGGHTVANQPPHYCPPLIHLHSPPPERCIRSQSRCGTESWTELELAFHLTVCDLLD